MQFSLSQAVSDSSKDRNGKYQTPEKFRSCHIIGKGIKILLDLTPLLHEALGILLLLKPRKGRNSTLIPKTSDRRSFFFFFFLGKTLDMRKKSKNPEIKEETPPQTPPQPVPRDGNRRHLALNPRQWELWILEPRNQQSSPKPRERGWFTLPGYLFSMIWGYKKWEKVEAALWISIHPSRLPWIIPALIRREQNA